MISGLVVADGNDGDHYASGSGRVGRRNVTASMMKGGDSGSRRKATMANDENGGDDGWKKRCLATISDT